MIIKRLFHAPRGRVPVPGLYLFGIILSVFLTSTALHSAALADDQASKPPSGKVFRFRLPFEPATLDWTFGDVPIWVVQNTMRGLFRINGEGKVVPDLMTQVSQKDDGKTWVFHIQSGLTWSDGVPLVTGHLAEGLRRLLNPAVGSSYSYFLSDIVEPGGVLAPSDLILELRLKRPTPFLPAILTHWVTYPVRPDLIAKWKDYGVNPYHMAFLGAYKITDWAHAVRLVLSPNTDAVGSPEAGFKRVEAWIVGEDSTAVHLYDRSQLEFMSEPGDLIQARPDLTSSPSPILYFVGVTPSHPLTAKAEGILALSAALDRSQIPSVLNVPHRPTLGYCPSELWQILNAKPPNDSQWADFGLKGDPELARAYLKKAGFESGKNVPPLTLRFFNRPAIKELAEWLQAQWKKNLGIEVRLDSEDTKTYWSTLGRNPSALFINSKGASFPDPHSYFELFSGKNSQNLGHWSNAQYDQWVREGGSAPSSDARVTLYAKASKVLLREKPALIPLYYRTTQYLTKPFVEGLVINPLSGLDLSDAKYE